MIDLEFGDRSIKMSIIDDGTGFNVSEAISHTGEKGSLGLMSMQERAQLVGARLEIQSAPGKGTVVIAEVNI